jgi:hypothetical protein
VSRSLEGCVSWVIGCLGLRQAEIAVGYGEIRSWPWRPAEHRRGTRPAGGKAMFPTVINRLRVGCSGRDISVDSLATELIIDGRLAHEATP